MSDERECFCGAMISQKDGEEAWTDANGRSLCYPDAEYEADRLAKHEPMDP